MPVDWVDSIEFFFGGELRASSNISVPSGISSCMACMPDLKCIRADIMYVVGTLNIVIKMSK